MRFKMVFTVTAIAMIGVAASLLAQQPGGQRGQGGQGGGRGGGGPPGAGFVTRMFLLRISDVRKELELADEQVAEIEKVDAALREKYGGGRGPGGGGQRGNRGKGNNNNEGALIAPAEWYFVQAQAQNQQDKGGGRGFGQPQTPEERAAQEKARLERAQEERSELAKILLPHQIKRLNEIYIQQAGLSALQDEEIAKELGISDAQKTQITKIRDDFSAKRREMFQPGGGGGDFEVIRAKIIELTKA